jgi:recombinational DNA repair protein RecT
MKIWIKLTKHFQGGSHVDYKHIEESEIDTEDKQEDLMEIWGENTDGGHAYGYRVDMHILEGDEKPPKEWLEKQVNRAVQEFKFIKNNEKV